MMQTGMVKQGLNSACHTYIDGTKKKNKIKTNKLNEQLYQTK